MTQATVEQKKPTTPTWAQWLAESWATNKPLTLVGMVSVVMVVVSFVGILIDPTLVMNEPAWIKPSKFAISLAMYSFTFLWLLTFIQGWRRAKAVISWGTAIVFLIEMGIIAFQAARGVRSHFNFATPMDGALFSVMGTAIFSQWGLSVVAAILLLRQKIGGAWGLSLKLGMVLAVVGAILGALMTSPTAEQAATMAATGQPTTFIGAHSVGVDDGGAGLPYVGWSTEGGDLRIGHFIGLHAMQVLPLLGWLIVRQNARLREAQRRGLVVAAAWGYLGVVGLVTWQALRGQPLLQPDGLTLAAAGVLVASVVAMVGWVLRRS